MLADLMEKAAEAKMAPNAKLRKDPPGASASEDGKDSVVLNEMEMKPAALKSLPP